MKNVVVVSRRNSYHSFDKLLKIITHFSIAYFLRDICDHCDPDQTPRNAESDQDLHCLLTENSIKI